MSATRMNILVVSVVLALTAGFVFGLLLPGLRKERQENESIAAAVAQVEADQRVAGEATEIYAAIQKLDAEMEDVRERVPNERRFGEYLSSLSDTLKDLKIEDYVVQPRPEFALDKATLPPGLASVEGTIVLPVSITFEGTFTQVFGVLDRIELLRRLCNVESLRVLGEEHAGGRVDVDLVLHTYYQPNGSIPVVSEKATGGQP